MFTGIIEEIGSLASIKRQSKTLELKIKASHILTDIHVGNSIAVNGVCLTVTNFNREYFCADVMPVTFQATNLAKLASGSLVNLERAMAANGRFGGHIVSGHVDAVGTIIGKTKVENAIVYRIQIPKELSIYCIPKGSVALDGTSLTIVEVKDDWISVSLIPHTQEKSLLGSKGAGDSINIECDILAKQMLGANKKLNEAKVHKSKLTYDFLTEHGFI